LLTPRSTCRKPVIQKLVGGEKEANPEMKKEEEE